MEERDDAGTNESDDPMCCKFNRREIEERSDTQIRGLK